MNNTAQIVNIQERRPIVKADIENGYDRLAHTLTNTLANPPVKLSAREYQIIHAVISKTYRFHKKMDWISSSQLSEITGIDISNISSLKTGLKNKNILLSEGNKIGINTVISDWSISQKQLIIKEPKKLKTTNETLKTTSHTLKTTNGLVISDPHNKKETITKETNTKDISAKRKKNNVSLPADFEVTKDMFDWARKEGVTCNIKLETNQFIDYHSARDSKFVNWESAWQTWMRNSLKFAKAQHGSKSKVQPENFGKKDYGQAVVNF